MPARDRTHYVLGGYEARYGQSPSYIGVVWLALALAAATTMDTLAGDVPLGEAAIGIYVLAAIVFKIASSTTFQVALVLLGGTAVLAAVSPGSKLTDMLALYVYLLLAVGAASALLELWHDGRETKKLAQGHNLRKLKEQPRKNALVSIGQPKRKKVRC